MVIPTMISHERDLEVDGIPVGALDGKKAVTVAVTPVTVDKAVDPSLEAKLCKVVVRFPFCTAFWNLFC